MCSGVKWSPDGACLLTASDDCWCVPHTAAPLVQDSFCNKRKYLQQWQRRLRVFDLPTDALERPSLANAPGATSSTSGSDDRDVADSVAPALRIFEGETVYDYAWYPGMLASDPTSCVFASTSRVCRPTARPLAADYQLLLCCSLP